MTSPTRVIGEWLSQDQLEGSRRAITVDPDHAAVIISDGAYGEPQIETRVETRGRFGNVGRAKTIEVLVADLTPFAITYELDDTSGSTPNPGVIRFATPVLSSDDRLITGRIQITLAVSAERPGLLRQIRRGRAEITDVNIGEALAEVFLSQVIGTIIASTPSSEVRQTADQFIKLRQTAETQLKSQLENYGLELRNFAPNLLPLQAVTQAEKEQFDHRQQRAERERDIDRIEVQRREDSGLTNSSEAERQMDPATKGGGANGWLVSVGILAIVAVVAVIAVVASGGSDDPNNPLSVVQTATPTSNPETTPSPTQVPTNTIERATAVPSIPGATATLSPPPPVEAPSTVPSSATTPVVSNDRQGPIVDEVVISDGLLGAGDVIQVTITGHDPSGIEIVNISWNGPAGRASLQCKIDTGSLGTCSASKVVGVDHDLLVAGQYSFIDVYAVDSLGNTS